LKVSQWWLKKNPIFWDTMTCSPLKISQNFGEQYHLHFQGMNCLLLLHAGFLLGLLFNPEDGHKMFP
jgi:hypothetical protein